MQPLRGGRLPDSHTRGIVSASKEALMKVDRLTHLLAFAFPAIAFLGYFLQRPYTFIGATVGLLIVTQIVDNFAGKDPHYPWREVRAQLKPPDTKFPVENLVLYVYVMVHLAVVGLGVYQLTRTQDWLPWVLFALPVGLSGANTLTIAHELMHGSTGLDIYMGRVALIPQFWTAHEYEHLYLHHRDEVSCTEEDTSFAKLGEASYPYLVKGLLTNYSHAWELQAHRLAARGAKLVRLRVFASVFLPSIVLAALVGVFAGLPAFAFFMLQAAVSVFLFLLGTYNQHYGLTRRKRANGTYEPFTYMNIWSADFRLTNRMFWNLARHAHHHLDPFCSYTDLKIIDRSPMLPMGYMSVLSLSLVPPLWFKVMNPRVADVLARRDQLEAQGLL
jgi:alkane 1-monooxygenase